MTLCFVLSSSPFSSLVLLMRATQWIGLGMLFGLDIFTLNHMPVIIKIDFLNKKILRIFKSSLIILCKKTNSRNQSLIFYYLYKAMKISVLEKTYKIRNKCLNVWASGNFVCTNVFLTIECLDSCM